MCHTAVAKGYLNKEKKRIHKFLSPGQWIFDDSNASRTWIPARGITNIV